MRRTLISIPGLALLVATACGGSAEAEDAGAVLACQDFRSAAQDQVDGLLTPAELRSELQEVQENARLSDDPEIAEAGRELLAEATAAGENINTPGYAAAVRRFGEACEALGH